MKIFYITMKAISEGSISYRLTAIEKEARGDEPDSNRKYFNIADDEKYISAWRLKLEARKALLERLGIVIQSKYTNSEDANEWKQNEHLDTPSFACTGEQLLEIISIDSSVEVKSAAPIASDSVGGMILRMEKVLSKLENIEIPNPAEPPAHIFNEHCEVHLPGNLLATYNETLLLEDSCTDALQSALNAGWRIVAVCPQAQRRPDYILGRFNPQLDIGGSAARTA